MLAELSRSCAAGRALGAWMLRGCSDHVRTNRRGTDTVALSNKAMAEWGISRKVRGAALGELGGPAGRLPAGKTQPRESG